MRSAKRALPALMMVTGTLAITACGTIHASGTSAAAPGTTSTQASAAMVEAYAVPNTDPRRDGAVDAQLVTNGAVSGRSSFGTATDVWQVHPTSPQSANCACLIAYQSDLGRSEFIRLPTLATAGWQVTLPGAAQQRTALRFGSTLLAQSGTSVAQASLAAGSPQTMTPTRAYRLPVISPDRVAGDFDPGFTIKVLRISLGTLAVTRIYDTGVVPGELRNSVVLPAGSSNAIIGLFYGDEHGVTAKLWTVAGTSMRSMATLPRNIALDASVIGNIVYLFGGPAKNQVSRLAIPTGVLSRDVASLRTPSNSWVLAVSAA